MKFLKPLEDLLAPLFGTGWLIVFIQVLLVGVCLTVLLRRHPLRSWAKVRENVEAVFVAIILALIIRHFSLEAFEIPTGSMAPGLHGIHVDTTCPNCDTVESVGVSTDSITGEVDSNEFRRGRVFEGKCGECGTHFETDMCDGSQAECPRCQDFRPAEGEFSQRVHGSFQSWCRECGLQYREVFSPRDCKTGHKILVNKFIYKARDPQRWDVIVFKFNRQRNYIKRLIGLPGEAIQVRDGDIYINGEIERKPWHAQRELWFPVPDSQVNERWTVGSPAWDLRRAKERWAPTESGGFKFSAGDGQYSRVTYQRKIGNRYPYNANKNPSASWQRTRVRDLRLLTDVTFDKGPGEFGLAVTNGDDEFRCWIPVDGGRGTRARVEVNQRGAVTLISELPEINIAPGVATELDFYLADRQLVLRIDGSTFAEIPIPEVYAEPRDRQEARRQRTSVAAISAGVNGELRRARVFRDIHYTVGSSNFSYATTDAFQLEEDEYFAMGDNSPSSLDSRAWGRLHGQNLLGRAFGVFWPLGEIGFIR